MGAFLQPTVLFFLLLALVALVIIAVVGFSLVYKAHDKDLRVRQEMQARELEHQRKMKELEIEKARLELEKARAGKTT